MAAFLGDPNFPDSALKYYRDGRQMLIQDLYERYSNLAFTKKSDRAVAILGLQARLSKAFKTKAAYGFFPLYFPRLLLWKRGEDRPMVRIQQPLRSRYYVPTWSWFSKDGPIKYMKLQFQEIEWATSDLSNPFKHNIGHEAAGESYEHAAASMLRVLARDVSVTKSDLSAKVAFDEAQEYEMDNLKCVVIGRDRANGGQQDRKLHVLIINLIRVLDESFYERVGVASLSSEEVAGEGTWVNIY